MRIGLLSPSIYMSLTKYRDMIFAPRDLVVSLADGLVAHGHDVTLFAAPDTKTKAHLVGGDIGLLQNDYIEEKMKNASSERLKWSSFYSLKRNYEIDITECCYRMAKEGKLDIIHSYHDTMAHFFDDLTGFPTIYTLHDPLPTQQMSLAYWLLDKFSKHRYVSISNAFRRNQSLALNFVATVYHGLDVQRYTPSFTRGSYLSVMGRLAPEKGIDVAIRAADKAGVPICVATSAMEENKDLPYYVEVIEPLTHKTNISFVGFMNGESKSEFFGKSQCLLFPIQWEEPFGMVMIEAMACGTPVIAYNRGSVSEIVKDGVTGFIVEPERGIAGLVEAIHRIGEIDRAACRRHVEEHFTIEKMVEGYERVYRKVLGV